MSEKHYVIVGSGVAAVHAAKAIRDHDNEAEISIYGEEAKLPYNRIKLSKGLFTDLHSEKVLIKKEKWYLENRIKVQSGTSITSIDPDNRMAITMDGQDVPYYKLLLCTGASNRKLTMEGASLHNVHNIRDMSDADRLKAGLQSGNRVCIIGGGVQGVETAWSFIEAGYHVTIVEAAQRLMNRQLDEASSTLLTHKITGLGADVRLGQGVHRIVGTDTVQGVELEDSTLVPCEHVVYSIGIIPNTDLAHKANILVQSGIVVNENMETSTAHVYAAGDAAEYLGRVEGLWGGAIDQGKIAGTNMTGNPIAYQRAVPVTLFNAFETPLFSIGMVDEQQCNTITHEDGELYTRIFIKEDSIVGVISFEGAAASLSYKTAIENKISLEGMDLAHSSLEEIMTEVMKRSQK
ncbi:MAG: FAD-dependent oxidoreductase [Paenibacillus sp.]|nr:FAD-dependent oxidoreductase [Paenibacillus sp.]